MPYGLESFFLNYTAFLLAIYKKYDRIEHIFEN